MSVASVTNTQSQTAQSLRSTLHQAKQDFSQIYQSLQSGDLASAQQAYSSIQNLQATMSSQSVGGSTTSTGTADTIGTTASSTVATDWAALGQALQSGNLSTAQSAFSTLGQDARAAVQTQMQQAVQNAHTVYQLMGGTNQSGSGSGASSTGNAVSNDLSALSADLQSGNTGNAQTVLAQLQQDLQSAGQSKSGHGFGHHHHHGGASNAVLASLFGSDSGTTSATASNSTGITSASTGTGGSTGASATS